MQTSVEITKEKPQDKDGSVPSIQRSLSRYLFASLVCQRDHWYINGRYQIASRFGREVDGGSVCEDLQNPQRTC